MFKFNGCVVIEGGLQVTVSEAAVEVALPFELVAVQRNCAPLSAGYAVVKEYDEDVLAPGAFVHVVPSGLRCHWYERPPPDATTVNVAVWPALTVVFEGFVVIVGAVVVIDVNVSQVAPGIWL